MPAPTITLASTKAAGPPRAAGALLMLGVTLVMSTAVLGAWPLGRACAEEVTLQITDDLDDFKETPTGRMRTKNAAHRLWSRGDAKQGYRFTGMPVPRRATVTAARLEMYATGSSTVAHALDGIIRGYGYGNAPPASSSLFQIRDAAMTTASVPVAGLAPWSAKTYNTVGDVTSILQEVVDRPDYVPGNAVTFFLLANSTKSSRRVATARKGLGARLVVSWNSDSAATPYYVRPVYFVARDDEGFDPDWEAKLQTAWTLIRQFYGAEMARNGYGYRPFNLELDLAGKPKIFFIRGQRDSAYYAVDPRYRIQSELEGVFSPERDVVSVTSKFGPYQGGGGGTPRGGYAFVADYLASDFATTVDGQLQLFCDQSVPPNSPPGYEGSTRARLSSVRFGGMLHELGHAFGVQHSVTPLDVVSLGFLGAANYFAGPGCVYESPPIIVPGTALVLDNSAFFRSEVLYTDNVQPTLSYSFPRTIAAGESLPIEFTVGDAAGAPAVLVINFGGASQQFDVSGLGNPGTFTHVFRFVPPLAPQDTPYRIGFELFDDSANRLIDDQQTGNPTAREFAVVSPSVPTVDPGEVVWMDDDFPAGAQSAGAWNLQTLLKASGARGHHHANESGFLQVSFENVDPGARLTVDADDALSGWVYIAPGSSVEMVGFQWRDGTEWHRAYWGADRIPADWVGHRQRIGDLPPAGRWVRLLAPAASVDLGGRVVEGFAFMVHGAGDVYMDRIGKVPPLPQPDPNEMVWAEDDFPAGASNGGPWDWQSAFTMSGARSHRHVSGGGESQAYFYDVATPLVLEPDALFRTYVYIVPGSQFETIDLQWRVGGGWTTTHWGKALWDDLRAGELPPEGSWVRLDVPVRDLHLEHLPINGFNVLTSGPGTLYVDRIGVRP